MSQTTTGRVDAKAAVDTDGQPIEAGKPYQLVSKTYRTHTHGRVTSIVAGGIMFQLVGRPCAVLIDPDDFEFVAN